ELLPWLPIPRFPQIGQPFAFADREDQLAELYAMIADAGNSLVAGQRPAPVRIAVTGYKGVGKSSLILHALGMLRDPDGQGASLPRWGGPGPGPAGAPRPHPRGPTRKSLKNGSSCACRASMSGASRACRTTSTARCSTSCRTPCAAPRC